MSDLYKHIEELGKERGFKNITRLCEAAGVGRATMSELKMGRSLDLSKPNAQKFADVLGVTLDEVYGKEIAPATNDARKATDKDLKIALFGGDGEVTDEMWEEAIFAAQLIKDRHKRKKTQND